MILIHSARYWTLGRFGRRYQPSFFRGGGGARHSGRNMHSSLPSGRLSQNEMSRVRAWSASDVSSSSSVVDQPEWSGRAQRGDHR